MDSAIPSASRNAVPGQRNSALALSRAPRAALLQQSPGRGLPPRESALAPLPSPTASQTPANQRKPPVSPVAGNCSTNPFASPVCASWLRTFWEALAGTLGAGSCFLPRKLTHSRRHTSPLSSAQREKVPTLSERISSNPQHLRKHSTSSFGSDFAEFQTQAAFAFSSAGFKLTQTVSD